MSKILNVLYQSNDNYAEITGVSMTSLLENNKDLDEINIFLLNDQISAENIEKLKSCNERYGRNLSILETDTVLTKLRDELGVAPHKGTYTTYFKLYLFKDIQTPTDRILQLDGDTIINESLAPLCDLDLGGYIMAATYDCVMNDYKALVGIPPTDKYYNCGVLLVNQTEWRKQGCEEQITQHLKQERAGYINVDQDILNRLFRHKVKYLDPRYNLNAGFYVYGIKESFWIYKLKPEYYSTYKEIEAACQKPAINHCMGAMTGRPWETNSIHPQNSLYDKYLALTPWKGSEKKKVQRSKMFKLQRFLYRLLPRGLYARIHQLGLNRYYLSVNKTVQNQK